jgi:NTE family protein
MIFPFKILALGSGGTKGFLHLGALQELECSLGNLTEYFKEGVYGCSIGSIFAAAIAFGLNMEQVHRIALKYFSMQKMVGEFEIEKSLEILEKKGVFDMDIFEENVTQAFMSEGVDLKNKMLSDSRIPLFVFATNITRGIPTIFKGDVPLMLALRASCCVPFLFRPQCINKNLFIDGAFLTNVMVKLMSEEDRRKTLAIYLLNSRSHVTPENINTMTPIEFMYRLYKTSCLYEHTTHDHEYTVSLSHTERSGYEDPPKDDIEDMIVTGKCSMRGFLASKRRD